MNNYQEIINYITLDERYKVKKHLNELIQDSKFMKMITKVLDPIIFDRFIKMCEYKIDTREIYEKRNEYIKKILINLDLNSPYKDLGLDASNPQDEKILNSWIIEYIINYYFQDSYYNFMSNFYQMITYLEKTNESLINKDHINLYNEFVGLRKMSLTDKIGFFKLLLDIDILELFYDDMNIVKNDSHKKLVDKSLKLNHDLEIYNIDISRRLNVDVYMLDGEDFFGFVRCLPIKRNDLSDHSDSVFSKKDRLGYSFSYIGSNNIGTTDYDGKSVTLFYDHINYEDIMYVHHGDLHSKKMSSQDDYLSSKENEIITPESLVAKTKNYNEIYIKGSRYGIKPTALVCYDRITRNEIDWARKYNLSILLINTRKYKRYETYDDDYGAYTYTI